MQFPYALLTLLNVIISIKDLELMSKLKKLKRLKI